MNHHHTQVLNLLKSAPKTKSKLSDSYLGSKDKALGVSNPDRRKVAKEFYSLNKNLTLNELVDLCNSLIKNAEYHDEKSVVGYLLDIGNYAKLRKNIAPNVIENWLEYLTGWAQIDGICQNVFTLEDMNVNWKEWNKMLVRCNESENISKRRASLVFLVGTIRKSGSKKQANLAFEFIDKLKHEKDILITKAISWLLRELTDNYRSEVITYLDQNLDSLPKIAVRETRRKIETGKK